MLPGYGYSSPIESTLELDSDAGHIAQVNLHADGTLRFETHNNDCVNIDLISPPHYPASEARGILNLGGEHGPARMFVSNTDGKMTIQAKDIMIQDVHHTTKTLAECETWVTQAPTEITHTDTCTSLQTAVANPDHSCKATDQSCQVSANLVVDQLSNQFSTTCGTELNFDLKDYVIKYENDRAYPINLYANTCYENTDFDITLSVYRVDATSCTQVTCVDDWDAHEAPWAETACNLASGGGARSDATGDQYKSHLSQTIAAGESLIFSVTASDFIHRSSKVRYGDFTITIKEIDFGFNQVTQVTDYTLTV